ncbi:hypothetical protein MINTMi198_07540 [Mycobacterium intracellulare M.i.198]|nr:hypothetical protein [Mycobacterium intracellulare]BCP35384.1 hypothetical protein MINTMi198_07540 [Mycobacterium intracellulare M.i.198]
MIVGIEDLVVDVDLQDRVGQGRHDRRERVHDGQRVHVGAQTLGVQTDDESLAAAAGPLDPLLFEHVRVRQYAGPPPPVSPNQLCGTGCQRNQLVGGGNQDVLLRGVGLGFRVMWIAQIVHRVHQRLVVLLELLDDSGQILRSDGVEPEVDVEHVES